MFFGPPESRLKAFFRQWHCSRFFKRLTWAVLLPPKYTTIIAFDSNCLSSVISRRGIFKGSFPLNTLNKKPRSREQESRARMRGKLIILSTLGESRETRGCSIALPGTAGGGGAGRAHFLKISVFSPPPPLPPTLSHLLAPAPHFQCSSAVLHLRPCYTTQFSQQLVSQSLKVAEIWCWGPVTLCNFLSNLSRNAPRNEKQEVCACALVKTAVKLEGWYTVQWCCQLLQSVAKSRTEFYFVQRFAQQKIARQPMLTLSNSPATCLAMALRRQVAEKIAQCNRAFKVIPLKKIRSIDFFQTLLIYYPS